MNESKRILNIAAYKFVEIEDLAELREKLRAKGGQLKLKGSILLSPEGINMFLAGEPEPLRQLLDDLAIDPRFEGLEIKESWTPHQPFRRFLVKLKTEIIAFGVDGISPSKYTSPRISATELQSWLQEGRPLKLLDVRNDYEIEVGTFRGAAPVGVNHFRDFPEAVEQLPDEWKQQPVVTFCTGGIRCEKAAPLLEQMGFEQVYQLDGGILKYFEEVGGEYYDGECFVFDQRVSVDPTLEPTDKSLCFACQAVLTPEDTQDERYIPEVSCRHCYKNDTEQLNETLKARQKAWAELTVELPGALPYEHERPLRVSERFSGLSIAQFLEAVKTHLSAAEWQSVIDAGQLRRRGEVVYCNDLVRTGDILVHHQPAHIEPPVGTDLSFLYEDENWIVVNKSAPLPAHPGGRFCRNTLTYLLDKIYHPQRTRLVHRLDASTTGVMILARHRKAAAELQRTIEGGGFEKTYLVRTQVQPEKEEFFCDVAISKDPVDGVRQPDPKGLPAETRFKVIRRLEDGSAILEAYPITGRTNQIRLHAWALGLPVMGDPIYKNEKRVRDAADPATVHETLGLHAWKLAFAHPTTEQRMEFVAPMPSWATL